MSYLVNVRNRADKIRVFDVQKMRVSQILEQVMWKGNSHAAAVAPSGVSVAQDGTTITVKWTPPSSAPSNGYMVYYTDSYSPSHRTVPRDEGSVSVSSGSASQVVIPVTDIVYTVSVVAVSDLPSVVVTAVPGTPRYVLPLFMTLQVCLWFYCMLLFRSLCWDL